MTAELVQLRQPDTATMLAHVEHMFGGYLDGYQEGLIELSWSTGKPADLNRSQWFKTDQLDELVDFAARLNSNEYTNVYIGAALRHPDTAPFGRSKDSDAWALTCGYCDLDAEGASTHAKDRYGTAKPTMVVVTGNEPYTRAQCWWRLDEPLTDQASWPNFLRGIAVAMGGDVKVCNPGRVMRLAGSIAWPVKEGRTAVEVTQIVPLKVPGQPVYSAEQLTAIFPPVGDAAAAALGDLSSNVVTHSPNTLGLADKVTDGRDIYMLKTVKAVMHEFIGTTGAKPTEQELFDTAWPQYAAKADLSRPGHGIEEMKLKVRYALRRFDMGMLPGMRDLDEAVTSYQARQVSLPPPQQAIIPDVPPQTGRFTFEKVDDLRKLPPTAWLVDKWIPERSIGIFYGKWATGKSFITFDLGLHLAYGMSDWHGVSISGTPIEVLVIAREGAAGFVKRIDAFKKHHGIEEDPSPFTFMRGSVNFMADQDFVDLCACVKAIGTKFGLVIVDTVARASAGQKTNDQDVVTLFMERCQVLGELTGAVTLGVHHNNKAGDMLGSTYFAANSDFLFEITRDGEDGPLEAGEIKCTKQKDGEDGWTLPVAYKKVILQPVSQEGSLVVTTIGGVATAKPERGMPDKAMCKRILNAIAEAWDSGVPWSVFPASTKMGRYAVNNIMRLGDITRPQVEFLLQEWQRNGVIMMQTKDSHTKMVGLKIMQSL